MTDLYLRTKTEQDMMQAMQAVGLTRLDEESGKEVIDPPTGTSVHWMGHMTKQTGTKTVDGEEVPTYTKVKKCHVNVRTDDQVIVDALQHLDCAPKTPHCFWMD